MHVHRLALAIAAWPFISAQAEPSLGQPVHELPNMLITGVREPQPRESATAASSVITRDDIERLQPLDLPHLLSRIPGLHVVRNGGAGSLTSIFLRGTSTAQTLVLVDGQRIAGASAGVASLEHLQLDQIERIEVIRGGRSALYGSDAIGGVIQIFTRRGAVQGVAPRASITAGSHDTWRRSVGVAGGNERTRFNMGASLDESGGFARTTLPESQDGTYRNKALSLSVSHQLGDDVEVGGTALHQSGDTEYDYPLAPAAFAATDFQISSVSLYTQARPTERWTTRLEAGHSEDRQSGEDPYGGTLFNTYRDQISWLNSVSLAPEHTLRAGAEWYEDRLHSATEFTRNARWNQAAYVQHEYKGERFGSEVGIRHDRNEQFDSETSANLALTWHATAHNDLIASYSESFRAPTFNDLYYPDECYPGWGCTVYANPGLQPEQARSYELQWRARPAPATEWTLSLYRIKLQDAIVTNNALDGNRIGAVNPYRPDNIDAARINGAEAVLTHQLGHWIGTISYAWVDARNRSGAGNDGNRLARRPEHNLALDVDRRIGNFTLGLGWQASSHSYDDLSNANRIPGYGLLDARASWQLNRSWRLALSMNNLLDREYYLAEGTAFDATTFDPVRYRYREGGRIALFSVNWTPDF